MSTSLIYNGIQISYVNTTSFNQEAVYDDMGSVDWYGTKFDVKVDGYINLDYAKSGHIGDGYMDYDFRGDPPISYIDPLPESVYLLGPAAIIKSLRSRLLAPRRTLLFIVNGIDLIPKTFRDVAIHGVSAGNPDVIPDTEFPFGGDLNQNKQGVDSDNGPKPQSCNIVRVSDNMFWISYHIIAVFYESKKSRNLNNVIGSNVLYNRWKETLDVDSLQYTKRTRNGRLKIRSDGTGVVPADVMTTMAVVGVPSGFVRDSSSYTISPDGLTLDYSITDKEVFKNPPMPALEASGTYSEILGRVGAVRHGELQLRLKSSKNIRQSDLVHRCIVIAFAKLNSGGFSTRRRREVRIRHDWFDIFRFAPIRVEGFAPASSILESVKLTVNMYENEVSISIRARLPGGTMTNRNVITWTPLSEPTVTGTSERPPMTLLASPTPNWPRVGYEQLGTAMLPLIAAAYYDPSLRDLRVNESTGQLENPGIGVLRSPKVPGMAGNTPENISF